jgi:hypothetical protein
MADDLGISGVLFKGGNESSSPVHVIRGIGV